MFLKPICLISSFLLCSSLQGQELIKSISVKQQVLTIEPGASIKETFLSNRPFIVQYDQTIAKAPETVLTIPYLLCLSPFIWLSQKRYTIKEMDYDTYYALEKIKIDFMRFYPQLSFSGEIIPTKLIKNSPAHAVPQTSLLFQGDVHSVSCSLGHKGTEQLLITPMALSSPYRKELEDQCRTFAQTHDALNAFIACNFHEILNWSYMQVFSSELTPSWIREHLTEGLYQAGLAIPLLYSLGSTDLYVPALHTSSYPYPYARHPLIDRHLRCAGIQVHHDQDELTISQKIELIISASQFYHTALPELTTCQNGQDGTSCLSCDYCFQTINAIIIAGAIPFDFGFVMSKEEAMYQTRTFLLNHPVNASRPFWYWSTIQKAALKKLKKTSERTQDHTYLTWLSTLKLDHKHFDAIHRHDAHKDYFSWLWTHT